MQILYEDNHIIIVNKAPGEIVQGDKTGDEPLVEMHKILTFVDDTHVKVPSVNGGFEVVELSQEGVWAYQGKVASSQFALK